MADRYFINSGSVLTTDNWSTTSGGTGGASIPGTSDRAIFDSNSGNSNVPSVSSWNIQDLDMTNYPNGNRLELHGNCAVYRNITGNSSSTSPIYGSGTFTIGNSTTAGAWAFNGLKISATNINCVGTGTKTMTGNVTFEGKVTWISQCSLIGLGYTMYVQGGWTGSSFFNNSSNNPTVIIQGGTLQSYLPPSTVLCKISPSVSDVIFTSGTTYQTTLRGSINFEIENSTYSTVHTDAITRFQSVSGDIKVPSNFVFDSIQIDGFNGRQLSDLTVNNLIGNSTGFNHNGNGYKIYIQEDWISYGNCSWEGTNPIVEMVGSGTFQSTTLPSGAVSDGTVTIRCDVIINTTGTINHQGKRVYFGNNKTLTYTSGVFNTDVSGVIWSITTSGYNLNIDTKIPTLEFNSAVTLNILSDFQVGLLKTLAGCTINITATKELDYDSIYSIGINTPIIIQSSILGSKAILCQKVSGFSDQQIFNTTFTDIDASCSSTPVYSWYGSVSNCDNVFAVTGENIGGGGISYAFVV